MMKIKQLKALIVGLFIGLLLLVGARRGSAEQLQSGGSCLAYRGVNLAGAEFGEGNLPGVYGTHYTYPTNQEVDYFMGKGMTTFRVPFRWERLQQSQYAALDSAELAYLTTFVNYATGEGAHVILDPHNYARYYGGVIGETVPVGAFADFWTHVANEFKSNPRVIFGLMNEPHSMSTELWVDDANTAIDAIRATGATNLILVPGNAWTGAHSWEQDWYGTPNAVAMLNIVDSGNNYAFDFHQYFDDDFSGTSASCQSITIGAEKLQTATDWLRANNRRGFLGEFAGGSNITCEFAVENALRHLEDNDDVWIGWTWWAAGPWWGNYFFTLEPTNNFQVDAPQMSWLTSHINCVPTAIDLTQTQATEMPSYILPLLLLGLIVVTFFVQKQQKNRSFST